MLTRNDDGVLFRHQALGSLRHFCWRWNSGITIEQNGHLLQCVASGFWVVEVHRDAQENEHDDEDEVVLPADAIQGDRVDESVEKNRNNGSRQGDNQATRTQAVRPDLAGICSLERCPEFSVSMGQRRSHPPGNSHCDIVASEEHEKKRDDGDSCCIGASLCERS